MSSIPPFLIFFAGALLVPFLHRVPRLRMAWLVLIPVIGALNVWGMEEGFEVQHRLMGLTLTVVRADSLSLLFGYLFHLGAFIAIIYSLHLGRRDNATVQHTAAVVYAGSALGAVFAGDFITLFVFWELLAISSVFLIWTQGASSSRGAVPGCALPPVPRRVRGDAVGRRHGALVTRPGSLAFGEMGLEEPRGLARLHRHRDQGRLPAPAQLADRRLPGIAPPPAPSS